nr:MAG: hypothetical protein KatS3mg041_1049 [Bacteroidota bacterium]
MKRALLTVLLLGACSYSLWAQGGTINLVLGNGSVTPPTISTTHGNFPFGPTSGPIVIPTSGSVDYYPTGGTATEPYNTNIAGGNIQITLSGPATPWTGPLTLVLQYNSPLPGYSFTPYPPKYRVNSNSYGTSPPQFPTANGGQINVTGANTIFVWLGGILTVYHTASPVGSSTPILTIDYSVTIP